MKTTKKAKRNAAASKPAAKPSKTLDAGDRKKMSALDAAASVLAAAKQPMNSQQLIKEMSAKNLWTSPGGKTPHATLYAAIHREISVKGAAARFVKGDRGQFAARR